jgi:hypothetical protein
MTTAERSERLAADARRRHGETRRKVVVAVRALDVAGEPASFAAVARVVGISRSWLYNDDATGRARPS